MLGSSRGPGRPGGGRRFPPAGEHSASFLRRRRRHRYPGAPARSSPRSAAPRGVGHRRGRHPEDDRQRLAAGEPLLRLSLTAMEEGPRGDLDIGTLRRRGAPNGIWFGEVDGPRGGLHRLPPQRWPASRSISPSFPKFPFRSLARTGSCVAAAPDSRPLQHAVVVVAEGAGQHLMQRDHVFDRDASGNMKLLDVGVFLREQIAVFSSSPWWVFPRTSATLIQLRRPRHPGQRRTTPCCANGMARQAVHAAMAGKTDVMIGFRHEMFLHVPIAVVASMTRRVTPTSELWLGVLEATGQPCWGRSRELRVESRESRAKR